MKRFPTIDHIRDAGIMTKEEQEIIESTSKHMQWAIPLEWITRGLAEDVKGGRVQPPLAAHMQRSLNEYNMSFRKLFCYDWVNIPLVYTQVVALAVYTYFTCCLITRQFTSAWPVDFYVPIFTILQLFFYMGWFKVGKHIMKPFGKLIPYCQKTYL
jgi:predicted membrane chloride channel (bestrophin family)